jgi:alpha-L-rhamnosidase
VNRLFENIRWSRRGNTVRLMTDCPQRDERLGWMGDALVFLPTAMWLADLEAFVTRWYDDVLDGRSDRGTFQDIAPVVEDAPYLGSSPGWADAGVLVPWLVYERYGTTDLLRRGFDAMIAWGKAIAADNPEGLWLHDRGNDYGDWLSVEEKTPKEVLATARHAWTLDVVARAADVLGRDDDAAWCRARRAVVIEAFREAYVTPSGRIVGHTQTAYVLALAFDLLPPELRRPAAGYLRGLILDDRGFDATFAPGHLTTGILGVVHVMDVLTDIGEVDLAYRLLENETYPSWGHQIANGATTLWERWDGWTPEAGFQTPAMNSFNHTSLGAVGQWLFTTVAGIRPDSPGFEEVTIAPRPGGSLTWAEATYHGPRGPIRSRWDRDGDEVNLGIDIPVGTTARVVVPGGGTTTVGAGHHRFTSDG